MTIHEKLKQIEQIDSWNAEKDHLVSAYRRLVNSGARDMINETASLVQNPMVTVTPAIEDKIRFDPGKFSQVEVKLEWGRRKLKGFDRTVGIGQKEEWWQLVIIAPVNDTNLEIECSYRSMGYKDDEIYLSITFLEELWNDREKFESMIADALFKAGVRSQANSD